MVGGICNDQILETWKKLGPYKFDLYDSAINYNGLTFGTRTIKIGNL